MYGKSSNELESLLNIVRIFSTNISLEFGLEKCATLTIHKGKATHTEGLTLSNNNAIKGLSLEESYKYLSVQQAEDVKHRQVKKQTSAEYTNRIRKILKSKLNGGNTIQAITNWAVHSGHSRLDNSRAGGPRSQNQEAHDCPSYSTPTE